MAIHTRTVATIVVLFILCWPLPSSTYAQNSGESKVYRTQFTELHSKVRAIIIKVENQAETTSDAQAVRNLRAEIFALQKLTFRLGEEAARSDLDKQKSNKTLLLISTGCEALVFVMMALDNFFRNTRSIISRTR